MVSTDTHTQAHKNTHIWTMTANILSMTFPLCTRETAGKGRMGIFTVIVRNRSEYFISTRLKFLTITAKISVEDVPLVEFMYLVFSCMSRVTPSLESLYSTSGFTVSNSGLCCCVPCLSSTIITLCSRWKVEFFFLIHECGWYALFHFIVNYEKCVHGKSIESIEKTWNLCQTYMWSPDLEGKMTVLQSVTFCPRLIGRFLTRNLTHLGHRMVLLSSAIIRRAIGEAWTWCSVESTAPSRREKRLVFICFTDLDLVLRRIHCSIKKGEKVGLICFTDLDLVLRGINCSIKKEEKVGLYLFHWSGPCWESTAMKKGEKVGLYLFHWSWPCAWWNQLLHQDGGKSWS